MNTGPRPISGERCDAGSWRLMGQTLPPMFCGLAVQTRPLGEVGRGPAARSRLDSGQRMGRLGQAGVIGL